MRQLRPHVLPLGFLFAVISACTTIHASRLHDERNESVATAIEASDPCGALAAEDVCVYGRVLKDGTPVKGTVRLNITSDDFLDTDNNGNFIKIIRGRNVSYIFQLRCQTPDYMPSALMQVSAEVGKATRVDCSVGPELPKKLQHLGTAAGKIPTDFQISACADTMCVGWYAEEDSTYAFALWDITKKDDPIPATKLDSGYAPNGCAHKPAATLASDFGPFAFWPPCSPTIHVYPTRQAQMTAAPSLPVTFQGADVVDPSYAITRLYMNGAGRIGFTGYTWNTREHRVVSPKTPAFPGEAMQYDTPPVNLGLGNGSMVAGVDGSGRILIDTAQGSYWASVAPGGGVQGITTLDDSFGTAPVATVYSPSDGLTCGRTSFLDIFKDCTGQTCRATLTRPFVQATSVQYCALGYVGDNDWAYWPESPFLTPFRDFVHSDLGVSVRILAAAPLARAFVGEDFTNDYNRVPTPIVLRPGDPPLVQVDAAAPAPSTPDASMPEASAPTAPPPSQTPAPSAPAPSVPSPDFTFSTSTPGLPL